MKHSMLIYLASGLLIIILAMALWRLHDHYNDKRTRAELLTLASKDNNSTYSSSLVVELPEPARRYFNYAIASGTPLTNVVELEMSGELGLGTKDDPKYQPMKANQILAPPYGLVWQLKSSAFNGSDGATPTSSWTRFWLFSLLPIVRVQGADHYRSAFGRVVAEAAFWSPASLLPNEYVRWEPVGLDSARAIVKYRGFSQAVDVSVDEEGALTEVLIQRWSNENPEKKFREQPFGGYPSEYRGFSGYRLPTQVEGGNHFGTTAYFPFFKANVSSVNFPALES
jgi:hypothetical protein